MNTNAILVVVAVLVMGWFALGTIYNLRRGNSLLHWIRGGLPIIGEKTTFRWMGTSVAQMGIEKAKKPFRRMDVLAVLAPRDVPWMWIMAYHRGRQDTLIFRGQLSSIPCVDLELADQSCWTGRDALKKASEQGWDSQSYPNGLLLMAPPGQLPLAAQVLAAVETSARQLAPRLWRLGLRKDSPHLEIHLSFPDKSNSDAGQWFEHLRELARAVADFRP